MLNLNFKRVNKTRPHGGYVPDSFMNHQKVKKKKNKKPRNNEWRITYKNQRINIFK